MTDKELQQALDLNHRAFLPMSCHVCTRSRAIMVEHSARQVPALVARVRELKEQVEHLNTQCDQRETAANYNAKMVEHESKRVRELEAVALAAHAAYMSHPPVTKEMGALGDALRAANIPPRKPMSSEEHEQACVRSDNV